MNRPTLTWLSFALVGCTQPNPAFDQRDELGDATSDESTDPTGNEVTTVPGDGDGDSGDGDGDGDGGDGDGDSGDGDGDSGDGDGDSGCGNGIVENEEECDDGNDLNDDECTTICTFPICGDGILGANEECDDGNLTNEDACTNSCTSASCGDGIVQVGQEQCDDGNAMNEDGCSFICTWEFRYAFVTSTTFMGGAIGGLAGADEKCKDHATAGMLPGDYMAWISANGQSPKSRFVKSNVPYKTTDHIQLADNWDDLIGGPLDSLLVADEMGQLGPTNNLFFCGATRPVWTGTLNTGEPAQTHCDNFTSNDQLGTVGSAESFMAWSLCNTNVSCTLMAPIYCFQQ